jgi:hypothetical protein
LPNLKIWEVKYPKLLELLLPAVRVLNNANSRLFSSSLHSTIVVINIANLEPVCFAEKTWLKVLFVDLLWEKNIIPTEKISWKIRIIRQTNMALEIL